MSDDLTNGRYDQMVMSALGRIENEVRAVRGDLGDLREWRAGHDALHSVPRAIGRWLASVGAGVFLALLGAFLAGGFK